MGKSIFCHSGKMRNDHSVIVVCHIVQLKWSTWKECLIQDLEICEIKAARCLLTLQINANRGKMLNIVTELREGGLETIHFKGLFLKT